MPGFFSSTFIPGPSSHVFYWSEINFFRIAFQKVDRNIFFSVSATDKKKINDSYSCHAENSQLMLLCWESRETHNKSSNLKEKETKRDLTQLP